MSSRVALVSNSVCDESAPANIRVSNDARTARLGGVIRGIDS